MKVPSIQSVQYLAEMEIVTADLVIVPQTAIFYKTAIYIFLICMHGPTFILVVGILKNES